MAMNGAGKASNKQPTADSAKASQAAWCNCCPACKGFLAPKSCPAIGLTAITTPMRPMKMVM